MILRVKVIALWSLEAALNSKTGENIMIGAKECTGRMAINLEA